jgi:hypothetical protein
VSKTKLVVTLGICPTDNLLEKIASNSKVVVDNAPSTVSQSAVRREVLPFEDIGANRISYG